jgi:hypothetical protein
MKPQPNRQSRVSRNAAQGRPGKRAPSEHFAPLTAARPSENGPSSSMHPQNHTSFSTETEFSTPFSEGRLLIVSP